MFFTFLCVLANIVIELTQAYCKQNVIPRRQTPEYRTNTPAHPMNAPLTPQPIRIPNPQVQPQFLLYLHTTIAHLHFVILR